MENRLSHLEVVERELRCVTIHSPTGDVPGYQMRFLVQGPPGRIWSEWFFLSNKAMEDWLRTTDTFVRTEGHLSPGQIAPSGPLQ